MIGLVRYLGLMAIIAHDYVYKKLKIDTACLSTGAEVFIACTELLPFVRTFPSRYNIVRIDKMKIEGVIWLRDVVDKLAFKHLVKTREVEEIFAGKPKFRFVEKGERKGEDVYLALGRTEAGRYLSVLFIYKQTKEALILSARDMARKERRQYGKK